MRTGSEFSWTDRALLIGSVTPQPFDRMPQVKFGSRVGGSVYAGPRARKSQGWTLGWLMLQLNLAVCLASAVHALIYNLQGPFGILV